MEIPALRQADFIRFGIVIRTAAAVGNFRFGFAPKINELFGSFRTCTLINFICLLRRGDTVNDVGIENLVFEIVPFRHFNHGGIPDVLLFRSLSP